MIAENAAMDRARQLRTPRGARKRRTPIQPPAASSPVDRALLETWALSYLERYASSAENLRRVLQRRVRRRTGAGGGVDGDAIRAAGALIEALVARYCAAGLVDDAAYAAGRAKSGLARGRSLRRIAAGLAAKGVGAADAAAAVAALRADGADPELAAACAFAQRRRIGPFRRDPAGADRQRELAAFARAGFERRAAEAVLACRDEPAVAALLADAASR
jgi:regulatory protein